MRGADIVGVDVAHRPALGDVFFRIQVDRIPGPRLTGALATAGNPLLIYGVSFSYEDRDYELRIAQIGPVPRFGLFRCVDSDCDAVGSLRGGYGTLGESVAVSLGLDDIGFEGGVFDDVSAFSAVGSYETGAVEVLDSVRLTDLATPIPQ